MHGILRAKDAGLIEFRSNTIKQKFFHYIKINGKLKISECVKTHNKNSICAFCNVADEALKTNNIALASEYFKKKRYYIDVKKLNCHPNEKQLFTLEFGKQLNDIITNSLIQNKCGKFSKTGLINQRFNIICITETNMGFSDFSKSYFLNKDGTKYKFTGGKYV